MGYTDSADVLALRIEDDCEVSLKLSNLHLFSYGAFSNVYRGFIESDTNVPKEIVIKKTWSGARRASSLTSYEIQILKMLNRLNHKNIVRLLYIYRTRYSDNYLKKHQRKIGLVETKMFAWQLFRGQYHLLRAGICHRDIKPQNLLIDEESGLLKIGDFGSSAFEPKKSPQPSYHVTRYYRPPELLLGAKIYGCEVDIWSSACVFGEMLRGAVLFPGKSALNQFELYIDCFGLPTDQDATAMNASKSKWMDMKLRYASKGSGCQLSKVLPITADCPEEAVHILENMLVYAPIQRLHGQPLLCNPFFQDIFDKNTLRPCGKPIACLSHADAVDVSNGDVSMAADWQSEGSRRVNT